MRRAPLLVFALLFGCPDGGAGDGTSSEGTGGEAGTTASTSGGTKGSASTTGDPSSSTSSDPDGPGSSETSSDDGGSGSSSESTGEPADMIAVAAGYGTRRVRSDDGLTWTDFVEVDPNGGDDDALLRGIGYGDGIFLAVGGAGSGFSMRSTDGVTWQDENHELGSFVSDVAWLDGTFVAAGGNGLRGRSLDGGVTWQDLAPYYSGHFRAIAAGNGVAVAVGHTYGDMDVGLVDSTSDGASWDGELLVGAHFSGLSIAFGAGVFVARDDDGDVRTTTDGRAWSEVVLDLEGGGVVLFADGGFVTTGDGAYWTSSDGTTWTELASPQVRSPVGWIEGQWLTLGWPATIDASSDLMTWQNVFAPGGSGLTDIAVGAPG